MEIPLKKHRCFKDFGREGTLRAERAPRMRICEACLQLSKDVRICAATD